MAIIDPQEEVVYSNEEQVVDPSELENPSMGQPQEPEQDNIPSKYKGKTVDEIIKMHQEAEKLIGRQAQEVGEVRKLTDELLKRQLESKASLAPAAVKEEEEIDFFDDPKKYVSKAVESHPAVQEAKMQALEIKRMQTLNRLKTEFPNFEATVVDPEFAEWVKASPVRIRLYASAESDMDYDSASELLSTWNYVKPKQAVTKPVNPEVQQAQRAAVKSATVDVGSNSSPPISTKIYRRADLIRLNLEDPERYESLQDEILAAYREGRVR